MTTFRTIQPNVYVAVTMKHALRIYMETGEKVNTFYTPTNMLRTIGKFTDKSYKRGSRGQAEALEDITAWLRNQQEK